MSQAKVTRRGVCTICTGPATDTGHGFYHNDRALGAVRDIPPHFAKVAAATVVFDPAEFAETLAETSKHFGLVGEVI